jgi:electron transfer flavoprotein alpha subunit
MRMPKKKIWILAETEEKRIKKVSFELLAWAASIAKREVLEITAILPGETDNPEELCKFGADRVLHINNPNLNNFLPEPWFKVISTLIEKEDPDVFLAAATTTGRTIMPYIAGDRKAGLTADCTDLKLDIKDGILYQTRPAAGGNIMATIKTVKGRPQMVTVRPNSIKVNLPDTNRKSVIENIEIENNELNSSLTFLKRTPFETATDDIQEAKTVIAGGKGLKKASNLSIIMDLADLLNANIGASREAVDKGWIGYPNQVGLSGKTITPDLYFAIGISGAIQHLAGMQTAGTIVAINNDPDAQIFTLADFGIVCDLFSFLPVFIEKLQELLGNKDKGNV